MRRMRFRSLVVERLECRRLLSNTYYVSNSGSDAAAGTSAAPWQTLQHAADMVAAGDTVDVLAGMYAGFIMGWDAPTAGTASAPITFQADPAAAPGSVIINARDNKTACGIDLEPGCDYITISGFNIEGGGSGGIGTYPTRGSGIKATGNNDVIINNTVAGVDYGFGIFCDSALNIVIQNNNVSGTGSHGNANYGHGIYVSGNTDGAVVRGNVIHDNDYIGLHINGDIGTSGAPGLVTHALIAGNWIYNNGQNGINADGLQSSVIENNLIYGYQRFGIVLYQIDAGGPSSNNIIVNNTLVSTVSGAGAAVRILNAGTGNTLLNNILLGGGGITYRLSDDSLPGLVSDYNVASSLVQSEDTAATETFAQWQAQTGQDTHSFVSTPQALFVNATGNDYHLSSSSPAIDAGTSQDAPATDLDGNPRPSGAGYDIGAYEFQEGTSILAPSANNQSVTTNQNTAVAITLTGSDPNTPPLPLTFSVTASPSHGSLSGTAPNLTYTPSAGYYGADSFQFKVNNGKLDSNIATVSITVVGAPTANNQSVSTNQNIAVAITLTGSDPNIPPLPLTFSVTASPSHGTLTGTAPNLTYTPNAGYVGADSFQFKDNNGALDSNIATVSLTVGGPPSLAPIADQTIVTGKSGTVTLQGSDADGDPLTYSALAQTQLYWLKQTYGIYEDPSGYHTSDRGVQEKYLRGTSSASNYSAPDGYWYYILPNGDFYEFTPPYTTSALVGALVAHLGSAVYNDPSLLWNAQPSSVPATLSVTNNVLTITPNAGYTGTFVTIASVSDSQASASRSFNVTVSASTNTPPTLAPIADQTIAAGKSGTVTLQGSDPDGDPLTYSAVAQTQIFSLKQTYGIYEASAGYYTNARGAQEEYLRGTSSASNYSDSSGYWYYLLPNGDFYEFTPPYTTSALVGALVAHLGTAVYNDPSLLWNAQPSSVPATLSVTNNVLTITPNAGYTGTFVTIASVSDGQASASRSFNVTVSAPPTLAPIPDQTIAAGKSGTVTLQGSDPDGDTLTYSAVAQTQIYWLKQTYGIYEASAGYYTNARGAQEEYLRGTSSASNYSAPDGYWYYLLPNGDFYEFTPPYTNSALTGALIAHLGTAVYNDPSLLWNAQPSSVPVTLSITNNVLTITPNAGYTGTFVTIASVSDGQSSASRSFNVTVTASANSPPTLAPIPDQTIAAGKSGTVTLQGSDPDGDPLTYSAVAQTQILWLKQTYGIYEAPAGYYTNARGAQEEYLRGTSSASNYSDPTGYWYYLLPNGDFYEFTPPYTTSALVGALVAHLGTAVYNDPSLLWNAQPSAVPVTLSITNNVLTITPNAGYTGIFVVIASVSDGTTSASRAFHVTVS